MTCIRMVTHTTRILDRSVHEKYICLFRLQDLFSSRRLKQYTISLVHYTETPQKPHQKCDLTQMPLMPINQGGNIFTSKQLQRITLLQHSNIFYDRRHPCQHLNLSVITAFPAANAQQVHLHASLKAQSVHDPPRFLKLSQGLLLAQRLMISRGLGAFGCGYMGVWRGKRCSPYHLLS